MVPSDVLIRTAIIAGLDDLRRNTFLLDYVFNWFDNDDLTNELYGRGEKQRAKEWFINTNIEVSMNYRADDPKFPLISIGLQSSSEDLSTLGDVNYDTMEDVPADEVSVSPNLILGPFTPSAYDPVTGNVSLPAGMNTSSVFLNQILYNPRKAEGFTILDILDSQTFRIQTGVHTNFTDALVLPIDTFYVAKLESCLFKQTFSIKCFVQGDPVKLLYLHSLLDFILLRYKEQYLEGRGFDRSIISSGPVYQYRDMGVEMTFARDVTLTGYCRQYWPKLISPKIQGVAINGIRILGGSRTPDALLADVLGQGWWMEDDFK
jgi:hypothetical protein